jgi:hypothetical protein
MFRKIATLALALALAGFFPALRAYAHGEHLHVHRPYVIEMNCDDNFEHCQPRMSYAPGQHAGLAGPGSYWYQYPHQFRGHHRHDRHVAWCADRYRTYDPHTDTFIGRGYKRYRCVSPYRAS